MSDLLVRGGRLLIPSRGLDETGDVLIRRGRVVAAGGSIEPPTGCRVLDAARLWVAPGLVDPHVHLREPGYEYRETVATGTAAAAAGGFTAVACMANTRPVNDTASVTRFILRKAREEGLVRVYPVGAVTVAQQGESLSEMADQAAAGCIAFSDDGRPIMNAFILRRALEYLSYVGKPLIAHAEDVNLANGGSCHEGLVSTALGLKGIPAAAEEAMVARDLAVVRQTGGRLHVAHVSTRGTLRLVADAKQEGLPVTCEVTPHHLFLTAEAVRGFDPDTKVNPPLREEADRLACLEALSQGIIDCVASDHAPHGLVDKELEFDQAAFGISGIETSLGLCLDLVNQGKLSPLTLVERMSTAPAALLNIPGGDIREGAEADLVLVDPELEWTVDPSRFASKGRNTPFRGRRLRGRAVVTVVAGKPVFVHESASPRLGTAGGSAPGAG